MENMPVGSRMQFRMNFTSGLSLPVKDSCVCNNAACLSTEMQSRLINRQ